MMKFFQYCIILLFCCFQNAFSQKSFGEIIMLQSPEEKIDLYKYTLVYTDSSKKTNFSEIREIYKKGLFKIKNEEALNFGIGDYNHWIMFQMINKTTQSLDFVIDSESASMDKIAWFFLENDSLSKQFDYDGWKASYETHPLPSRTQSVDLHLKPLKVYTCFMMVNRKVGTATLMLEVLPKKDFYQKSLFQLIFILFLVGAFTIMALIGIILFVITFQRLYLAYFLHTVFLGFYFFYRFGIINMLYFENPKLWMGPHGSFLITSAWAASTVFFTLTFLPVKWIISKFYRYFGYLLICISIFIFVIKFNTYLSKLEYNAYYIFLIFNIIYILFVAFRGLIKKDIKSKIFLFAMLVLLIYFLYYLISLTFGHTNRYVLYGMFLASFFEITIFCTSLIIQFIGFQKNNIELTQSLIKTQKELLNSEEIERQRLAQDLHDDLGGTLSAIKGKVANEMQNSETLNLVEKAIEDLRSISRNLLPPELAKNGLSKAIQQSIDRLQSATLEFTFITFGNEKRMDNDRELNIYRVVSELLNNVVKHSKATKVTVQVIFFDEYLQISVEDNGIGIKTEEKNWGIGLKNVNSRIEFLKAKLLKDSNDNGTTFIMEVSYI
jgi:signal transduction histidine kinase